MSRSCSYTHDVSTDRFEDLDIDTWQCPHARVTENGFCVFHAASDTTDAGAAGEKLKQLAETESESIRVIGATFDELAFEYAIVDGPSNHPIDAREATVDGEISLERATVKRPIRFDGGQFCGPVILEGATVTRGISFAGGSFDQPVTLELSEIDAWFDIHGAEFHSPVITRVADFRDGIFAEHATFHAAADFMNTSFYDFANFFGATFHQGAVFDSSTFEANAGFAEATFHDPVVRTTPETDSSVVGDEDRLAGVAVSMTGIICGKNVRFTDTHFSGDVLLADSQVTSGMQTDGITTSDAIEIDCSGMDTLQGTLGTADGSAQYDATGATLGEVSFADNEGITCLRFRNTRFDGFDFGTHKEVLAANGWWLHDRSADFTVAELENLYLRAKNGAKSGGETRAAAEFFTHEMRFRRIGYRQQLANADNVKDGVTAGWNWFGNIMLDVTCGYGERAFRPVVFSVGVIGSFALLFSVLQPDIVYQKPIGYLIFSIEVFVSVILGLPTAGETLVSLLIVLEAFSGGFIIALLVFTLTRSVSR